MCEKASSRIPYFFQNVNIMLGIGNKNGRESRPNEMRTYSVEILSVSPWAAIANPRGRSTREKGKERRFSVCRPDKYRIPYSAEK